MARSESNTIVLFCNFIEVCLAYLELFAKSMVERGIGLKLFRADMELLAEAVRLYMF